MYISLLRLRKYKRLMMSNIQSVEWTPTKNLMIIIGSNGSGKSSIMDELTPVPSHHSNFDKGGSKEFHCTHQGVRYILVSNYDRGTGHHSFKRDDVELNPGGTFAVQEELCRNEFNLSRNIHEILTGRTKFTQLSTAKRRELLTQMSVVDLNYTFEVFDKVKQEHRSQQGTIDTITKRLVGENHDLLNDAEVNRLREETQRLTTRLNRLFREKTNNNRPAFEHTEDAQAALNAIIAQTRALLVQYPRLSDRVRVDTEEMYRTRANVAVEQYRSIDAVVDRLMEELEQLRSTVPSGADRLSPEEIQRLKQTHQQYLDEAAQCDQQLAQYTGEFPVVQFDISGSPIQKVENLFERWLGLLHQFPDNGDGWMNRETASVNKVRLAELQTKYRHADDAYLNVSRRLSRLKGCTAVICPQCNHDFQPGVDPTEQAELEKKQAEIGALQDQLQAEIKDLEHYLTTFQDYSGYVFNFVGLTKDYQQFEPLWSYCASNMIMYRTPAKYVTTALQWKDAQLAYVKAQQALAAAKVLEQRLAVIAEIDQDAVGYMKRRALELEHEIESKTHQSSEIKQRHNAYVRSGETIQAYIESVNRVLDDYARLQQRLERHAEFLLDKAYNEEISTVQLKLANTQQTLTKMEHREQAVRVLENEVSYATEVHSDLALLIKALSPKGGLLGRYLMGFMQGVVQVVNAYINEVWTYPMEVLPSKVEKDELDYNFPLKVAGGSVVASDISMGSDSQLEMVNFAFRMAVMKFMGYEDQPLYLDEFGRTFDEQHRANLIPFISRLIENGQFRQVFYISHFESTHGAFNQAEIFVLDPTNVTVPEVYNKNVVLK